MSISIDEYLAYWEERDHAAHEAFLREELWQELTAVPYEDADQRLGGNDNPYED